ncbi:MAG: Uma2 family endonuclease [Candidatus Korobacteraceae bacterium]
MATLQTSLSDYLRTSFHPDCDFVDGEVQERNLGEFDHAAVQAFLTSWFYQHRHDWALQVLPEMRIRVSERRVRIADVCLVLRGQPIEQVLTHPPLAVIEILSSEDRISRYNGRLTDYRRMGIQNVWVIDPATRVGYDCSTTAWLPAEEFHISGTPIFLPLSDLWRELEANR